MGENYTINLHRGWNEVKSEVRHLSQPPAKVIYYQGQRFIRIGVSHTTRSADYILEGTDREEDWM